MEQTTKTKNLTHHLHTNLDWTNKAIEDLKHSGPINDRLRLIIPFKFTKGSFLKGVSIRWTPKKNKKVFQLVYWYQDRTFRLDLGEYTPNFGVQECQEYILELFKKYKDRDGNWKSNPKYEIKTLEEIESGQKLTIRKVIELICENGFPRKKIQGFLSSWTCENYTRYLIGYNERRDLITYIDDEKGWGRIIFKEDSSIKNWKELFKKYPPGVGLVKSKHKNRDGEISLYDSDLGALLINDLTPGVLEQYLETNSRSYGTKEVMRECISCLWNFARSNLKCLGTNPPLNPARKAHGGINIRRDERNNYKGRQWNELVFTVDQLARIEDALKSLRDKYPFIAEAILFLLHTGIRIQECLKLRWDMLTIDEEGNDIIKVKRHVLKGRGNFSQEDEIIDITPNVAEVLAMVKEQFKKPRFRKYQLLNTYIFLTTRISMDKLLNPAVYPGYKDSQDCRLKEVGLVNCWKEVRQITGINGAIKTLRKSFNTLAVDTLGSTTKAKSVTHHKVSTTLDRHYVKTNRATSRGYAQEIAKVLQFNKA